MALILWNHSSPRAFIAQMNIESHSSAKRVMTAQAHALAISLSGRIYVHSLSFCWIDTAWSYNKAIEINLQ